MSSVDHLICAAKQDYLAYLVYVNNNKLTLIYSANLFSRLRKQRLAFALV